MTADNHFDSIMALDLSTREIKWATRALPFDSWTVACLIGESPQSRVDCIKRSRSGWARENDSRQIRIVPLGVNAGFSL